MCTTYPQNIGSIGLFFQNHQIHPTGDTFLGDNEVLANESHKDLNGKSTARETVAGRVSVFTDAQPHNLI